MVAKRFVLVAFVAWNVVVKSEVEVALVVVAFSPVKFWSVVEPSVRKLVEKRLVAVRAVLDAYGKVEAEEDVEVIIPPTNRLLEMYPPPWTERREPGLVVPMPTLPLESMRKRSVETPLELCVLKVRRLGVTPVDTVPSTEATMRAPLFTKLVPSLPWKLSVPNASSTCNAEWVPVLALRLCARTTLAPPVPAFHRIEAMPIAP